MSKWLYFHASAIDSSSVISHDTGTNIDFGAFPADSLTSIMAEEDHIYLYFKDATRFENGLTSTTEQDSDDTTAFVHGFETMEQVYVRLTVSEGTEHTVIESILNMITNSNRNIIRFNAVNSIWDVPNVTAIQIRRHLTTHTIASD